MNLHLYKYSMNKLEQFKRRNQKRNSQLYADYLTENIDYILCPVSNERLSMIKTTYIERVLAMTVAEYDRLFPGIRGVTPVRRKNIKDGLKEIDKSSGLTKHQLSCVKAKQTLSTPDVDGVSGYDKKGKKTRATHMNNIDQFGRNGYRQQADARLITLLPNGLTVEQNAHIKQRNTLIKNNKSGSGGASKLSKRVLSPIIEYLDTNSIPYYFDKSEYGILDKDTGNYYFWDLTIPDFSIAIEYQSNAWHADPGLSEELWETWCPPKGQKKTANEVLVYDYNKARSLYKHRQFNTYFVWQNTQKQAVKELLCLLKTLNTKY